MSLSREDMLRELELLPMWQLRAPLLPAKPPVELILAELNNKDEAATETAIAADTLTEAHQIVMSDDKKWAFICADSTQFSALQASLFNNILLALHVNKTHTMQAQDLTNVNANVLIIMGESTAQSLLKTDANIDSLRGKVHLLASLPVIVTYHPQDLLQHLPTKAKMWDDLCLALSCLNA